MADHTPGPWRVAERYGRPQGMPWEGDAIRGAGNPGTHVAVVTRHDRPAFDEGAPNARLIAAAPDLLAALEKGLATASDTDPHDPEAVLEAISYWQDLARAAIAAATKGAEA